MTRNVVAAGLLLGLFTACYFDRLPPPSFRYACASELDCEAPETCVGGLCQIRCTQRTFATDCPQDGRYLACFNGVCASTCDVVERNCPARHDCIAYGPRYSGLAAQLGLDTTASTLGLCGSQCPSNPCPGDEVCSDGFCFAPCDPSSPASACAPGLICGNGYCVPGDLPGLAEDSGGSDSEGELDESSSEG